MFFFKNIHIKLCIYMHVPVMLTCGISYKSAEPSVSPDCVICNIYKNTELADCNINTHLSHVARCVRGINGHTECEEGRIAKSM